MGCSPKTCTIIFTILHILIGIDECLLFFSDLADKSPKFIDFATLFGGLAILGVASFGYYSVIHNKSKWVRLYAKLIIAVTIYEVIIMIYIFFGTEKVHPKEPGETALKMTKGQEALFSCFFILSYIIFALWHIHAAFAAANWIEDHSNG